MTGPGDWFSSDIVTALGLALVHFIWQGAAIAVLAFATLSLTRTSTIRYLLCVCALALMLAAPLATFLIVSSPAPAVPAVAITDKMDDHTPAGLPAASAFPLRATPILANTDPFIPAPDLMSWLVAGWLTGVALLSLRSTAGYLHLRHMLRQQTSAPAARMLDLCRALQHRIGLDRAVTYLECDWLDTPAALGWLKPIILLPVASLSGLTQQQLEAVIVHELAHIRRLDFLVNLFQLLAETLFFYHPGVWWLNRRIRAEREYCCDEIAVSVCGDRAAYARALALMEEWRSGPGLAMAANAGPLGARIQRLLQPRSSHSAHAVGVVSMLLLVTAGLLVGGVAITLAHTAAAGIGENQAVHVSPSRAIELEQAGFQTPAVSKPPAEYDEPIAPKPRRVRGPALAVPPSLAPLSGLPDIDLTEAPVSSSHSQDPAEAVPAPVAATNGPIPARLGPTAPFRDEPWAFYGDSSYCRTYSRDIVSRGANQPMVMDDALQQRFVFFYWRCMLASGQKLVLLPNRRPVYTPIGAASPYRPANVSGTWLLASPPWPASRSCTFSQTGNAITGSCKGPEGSGAASGIVDGQQVRWSWKYADDKGRNAGELDFIAALSGETGMSGNSILVEQMSPWASRPINQVKLFNATLGGRTVQLASQ